MFEQASKFEYSNIRLFIPISNLNSGTLSFPMVYGMSCESSNGLFPQSITPRLNYTTNKTGVSLSRVQEEDDVLYIMKSVRTIAFKNELRSLNPEMSELKGFKSSRVEEWFQ